MELAIQEVNINIPIGGLALPAILSIPKRATGIIIFVHGSGSSRFSTRNVFVAQILQKSGFATLLFDLLTQEEDQDHKMRFDIQLLTDRLASVTEWVAHQYEISNLDLGYFGASTGAAAALNAAANIGIKIKAIVSRGGRPDLSNEMLSAVKSPTLLILGSLDDYVIELNKKAMNQMTCQVQMQIIDGASHLFSEQGKLEKAAWMAVDWFQRHMSTSTRKMIQGI